ALREPCANWTSPHSSPLSRPGHHAYNTEALVKVSHIGFTGLTGGGAAEDTVGVPAATTEYPRDSGTMRQSVAPVSVKAPLPYIAVDVKQAECIGAVSPHGCSTCQVEARRTVDVREGAVKVGRCRRKVISDVEGRYGASPTGVLPLHFAWQTITA